MELFLEPTEEEIMLLFLWEDLRVEEKQENVKIKGNAQEELKEEEKEEERNLKKFDENNLERNLLLTLEKIYLFLFIFY